MIQLPDAALPPAVEAELQALQDQIDALPTYAKQVDAAKEAFKRHNVKGKSTFDTVKQHLDRMCSGARRCGYCEDSVADEVEHIRPKNFYPDRTFIWSNYLYACGPCNGPKQDKFALYLTSTGRYKELTRPRKAIPRRPPHGTPLLIDPRHENPLDFMILDLTGTFLFQPLGRRGSKDWRRAEYTIEILHLNDREYLQRARRNAYSTYKRYLGDYIRCRDEGEDASELSRIIDELRKVSHPTVWREIQRQRNDIPHLRTLFGRVPEAINW